MRKKLQRMAAVALATASLTGVALACERREGPMEEAGEAVDETAEEIEDEVDDATD